MAKITLTENTLKNIIFHYINEALCEADEEPKRKRQRIGDTKNQPVANGSEGSLRKRHDVFMKDENGEYIKDENGQRMVKGYRGKDTTEADYRADQQKRQEKRDEDNRIHQELKQQAEINARYKANEREENERRKQQEEAEQERQELERLRQEMERQRKKALSQQKQEEMNHIAYMKHGNKLGTLIDKSIKSGQLSPKKIRSNNDALLNKQKEQSDSSKNESYLFSLIKQCINEALEECGDNDSKQQETPKPKRKRTRIGDLKPVVGTMSKEEYERLSKAYERERKLS